MVWTDAATQIFYSFGVAFGCLHTMSSYNKFHNNTIKDALIVSLVDFCTSIFAGFAIFSLLGFMAYTLNKPVEEVVDSGPGLAFIAYPEGIARMPVAPIWAFLFFFMIFTLGIDSQFAMMETVISGFIDAFPNSLRPKKTLFTFICCIIGFFTGLPQVTKGGIYLLTLVDWYSGSYNLLIVSFCELICICYVYGITNFRKDIEMMVGRQHPAYWIYWYCMWCIVTPVAICFILIMTAVGYSPANYGDYVFPGYAEAVGWLMVCSPIVLIVAGFIIQSIRYGIPEAFKKQRSWGPALDDDRTGDIYGRYLPLNDKKVSDILQNRIDNDNLAYINDTDIGEVKYHNGYCDSKL